MFVVRVSHGISFANSSATSTLHLPFPTWNIWTHLHEREAQDTIIYMSVKRIHVLMGIADAVASG